MNTHDKDKEGAPHSKAMPSTKDSSKRPRSRASRQLGAPGLDYDVPTGLTDEQKRQLEWEAELIELVRPVRRAKWEADFLFAGLERSIEDWVQDYKLNLLPDFQRGHVWTEEQQVLFVESVLRGAVTTASILIQFNCPFWDEVPTGDLPREMQCVDGLQRLTAVRRFMNSEIKAFGKTATELSGSPFDPRRYRLCFAVHTYQTRAELLQYYIDLNTWGTPHSEEEIARVRKLRDEALTNNV